MMKAHSFFKKQKEITVIILTYVEKFTHKQVIKPLSRQQDHAVWKNKEKDLLILVCSKLIK